MDAAPHEQLNGQLDSSAEPRAVEHRVQRAIRRSDEWSVRRHEIEDLDTLFPLNKEDPVISLRTELAVLHHAFCFHATFAIYIPGMEATQEISGKLTALTTDPAREHRELCVRLEYEELPEDLRWRLQSASRRVNDNSSVWIPLPYIHRGIIEILDRGTAGEPHALFFYGITGGTLRFPEA